MHNAVPDRVHGTWGGLSIDMNTRTCFVVFCVAVAVAGNTSLPKAKLEFVEGQRDRKRHNWNMPLLNSQEVFVLASVCTIPGKLNPGCRAAQKVQRGRLRGITVVVCCPRRPLCPWHYSNVASSASAVFKHMHAVHVGHTARVFVSGTQADICVATLRETRPFGSQCP